jgi:hypothetical protein
MPKNKYRKLLGEGNRIDVADLLLIRDKKRLLPELIAFHRIMNSKRGFFRTDSFLRTQ